MYLDPKIYDPAKLEGDERLQFTGFEIALDAIECEFDNIIYDAQCDIATIETLYKEIVQAVKEQIMECLECTKTEYVCSLMENNLEKYSDE